MCQQHPQFLTAYRLHMHRTIKPRPHHLRDATRIVAVRLVDLRLQRRPHVPRLDADRRQARLGQRTEQPLRQRSSFQPNPLEAVGRVCQHRQQSVGFARYLHFPNDLARVIHNEDAGLLDRNVQSSKMLHAALLLLMLEAAQRGPRFTISLKRSTQILQLSTSRRPITPSLGMWSQPVDATPILNRRDRDYVLMSEKCRQELRPRNRSFGIAGSRES